MRALALFILLSVPLAGCLNWFDDRPDYEDAETDVLGAAMKALEIGPDGGIVGGTVEANLKLIGYNNGLDNSGDPMAVPTFGTYQELAVTENYAYMTRSTQYEGFPDEGNFGGFSIFDVRDPTDPFFISHFEAMSGSDIEVNDDETYAFMGTQRNRIEEHVGRLADTTDPTDSLPRGIYVVDIRDKTNPTLDSFVPLPYNGIHTIEYARHPVTQNEYIIACTYDLYGHTLPATALGALQPQVPGRVFPLTQRVQVFEIQDNPLPGGPDLALVPVSYYQILENGGDERQFWPHDSFVQQHPVTGDVLLYVAYWDKGVRILDFNDPTNLQEISGYTEFAPSAQNNIHQVRAMPARIGDAHVVVAEPEVDDGPETGQITFLDTTDPAAPFKAGYWTQPNDALVTRSFDHSPHNFDVRHGQVALSHYQLGVWVIDISDAANLEAPKTVGFYLPDWDGIERGHSLWSASWQEHPDHGPLVYAVDEYTGLHILEYAGPEPVPPVHDEDLATA